MPGALHYSGNPNLQNIELLASAARTATGTGTAVSGLGEWKSIVLQLDVTAAATAVGDTLDVFVQTTIDGTNWVDVHHFTQVLGNGGAKRYYAKVAGDIALTEFENGAALAAAASRSIVGDKYRIRWAITDADTVNASFTFSVKANVIA
jgi:hypothetical protein